MEERRYGYAFDIDGLGKGCFACHSFGLQYVCVNIACRFKDIQRVFAQTTFNIQMEIRGTGSSVEAAFIHIGQKPFQSFAPTDKFTAICYKLIFVSFHFKFCNHIFMLVL